MHPLLKFRQFWRRAIALALLPISWLAGCQLAASPIYSRVPAAGVKTTRVLFIGDSLTYYNDLPGLLQQLSANEPHPVEADDVTVPLATLEFLWNNSPARAHLDRGHWDYVVLQEFSTRPATDPKATRDDYRRFGDEVARIGAQPIIFENWTRRDRDAAADFAAMQQTYQQVQRDIGGQISPIGPAWKRCLEEHPDIQLYVDDRHPSPAGTYLAACVLYRTIYHKPANGLATALPGLTLSAEAAAKLQRVADEVGAGG